jgi:3-phosphoshikimate 1-carboxyvinyltransferase
MGSDEMRDVAVPGDKSITHRALMFAAAARGESRLAGLLPGEDCRSTAVVLRGLGCDVPAPPADGSEIVVRGKGIDAWRAPSGALDCGNSGTTSRLMMGWLASRPFASVLTGDASLRSRPMRRITAPLAEMGARFRELESPDRLPIEVTGGGLRGIDYASPKASGQIKSAVLLAGLGARVPVSVTEPVLSRDHTERMLASLGAPVRTERVDGGVRAVLDAWDAPLPPLDLRVPGDPSSAAFVAAFALLAGVPVRIRSVLANPTRTGFFDLVRRMGASIEWTDERTAAGEPVGDLVVRPSALRAVDVAPEEVPAAIDEIPVLAALAVRAEGETRIAGAGELRVKESDRIAAIVNAIRAIGGEAEETSGDGLVVRGTDAPLRGRVVTHADHRIAMAFGVLGASPRAEIDVDDRACADVSFPGFWSLLEELRAG